MTQSATLMRCDKLSKFWESKTRASLLRGFPLFKRITVKPRFNEVAGDRPNLFVKSRVRYIENLDITNLRGND